jgi:integrase
VQPLVTNNLRLERDPIFDNLILQLDTGCVSNSKKSTSSLWQHTQYANLVRYVPSGKFFARVRVQGKLFRKSLKTDKITVAKLRLADLEKALRHSAETQQGVTTGKMSVADALVFFRQRLEGDGSLKPGTKDYYEQRVVALFKSWPSLKTEDVRRVTKADCLNWAARFGKDASPTAYNNTVAVLRQILEISVEAGVRYDNPARFIKRVGLRPKKLRLPETHQFEQFVAEIEKGGGRYSQACANLVRFLAFGGFRKSEAANITWADCDLVRQKILVRGNNETGTKNHEFREVPLIDDMKQLLERLRTERSNDSANALVMSVQECQKAMNRAAEAIGIDRITHHDLRHLFATRCIESGVDIPTVSRWLGHKDGGALAMRCYGHLRDQHSVNMAQKVSFSSAPANVEKLPTDKVA